MEKEAKVIEELQSLLTNHNITIDELIEIYEKQKKSSRIDNKRKVQHYSDGRQGIWCYFVRGEMNPCGCGSNCYHYEYDSENKQVYGVCNACNTDIYEVKEEYVADLLTKGIWK